MTIGVIKDRQYWSADEIVVGLAALLSCFEMVLFAFLHVRAFTYLPYRALAAPLSDEVDPEKGTLVAWNPVTDTDAPSPLKHHKGPVARRPDGSPFLQQTRRWPALLRVLDLRDLFVEIKEETRFVARGGAIGQEALMNRRREEALKAVTEAARPVAEKDKESARDWEDEAVLERDDAHLRHGDLAYMPLTYDNDVPPVELSSTPRMAPTSERRQPSQSWQDSLRRLRFNPRFFPPFAPASSAAADTTAFPYQCYDPTPLPFVPDETSVLPPPHRLQTPHLRPPTELCTRHDLPHAVPQPNPPTVAVDARRDPSSTSSFAASSDSYGHLPHTTLRPTSYVPARRLEKTPSPPPFAMHWQEPCVAGRDLPSAAHPAKPAQAASVITSEPSRGYRDLPPGAAPPSR